MSAYYRQVGFHKKKPVVTGVGTPPTQSMPSVRALNYCPPLHGFLDPCNQHDMKSASRKHAPDSVIKIDARLLVLPKCQVPRSARLRRCS